MGYALEVKMIAEAHKEGLLTTPYVFSEEDAADMAAAGADIIVCHLGLTVGMPPSDLSLNIILADC